MKVTLIKKRQLGAFDKKYKVWRQSEEQMKRIDISPKKFYLVNYDGIWLIGQFGLQWYGWNFSPNLGSMSIQIDHLLEIYEMKGFSQKKEGSTGSFIMNYLKEEKERR
jgi:hypothetical protein